MKRGIKKRSERYMSYKKEMLADGQYKITVFYFIDTGNPVRDIDLQRVKYITCPEQDLIVKTKEIQDRIQETRWRVMGSLRNMGATDANIDAFIRQRMR